MKKFKVSFKFTTKESEFENKGYGLGYESEFVEAESTEEAIDLFFDHIKDNSANMIDFDKGENYAIAKTLLSNGEIENNYYIISSAVKVESIN